MKKLLLFLCCTLFSTIFYGQTISGPTNFCSTPLGVQRYEVFGRNNVKIQIYGGDIVTANCTSGILCRLGREDIDLNADNAGFELIGRGLDNVSMNFTVIWNNFSTQSHRIVYESIDGKRTQNIEIHNSSSSYVSGPNGFLCRSYTGGTYIVKNLQLPYTVTWSGTNSGGGSLNFSSPNSQSTNVSGFSPGSLHSVNAQIRCNGVLKRTVTTTVVTGMGCRINIEEEDANLLSEDIVLTSQDDNNLYEENDNNALTLPNSSPKAIKIFPNPIGRGQEVNFQIPENLGIENIAILNSNGQIVKNINVENRFDTKVETSSLSAGMYFVQFKGDTIIKPQKIIVNNQ